MSDENTKLTIKDQLDSFIKAYPKAKTLSCTFRGSGDSFEEFDDISLLPAVRSFELCILILVEELKSVIL